MKLSNAVNVAPQFKRVFGVDLNEYLIPEFKLTGLAVLNIPKLDDYLLEKHSDYVDGMSMEECVKKHYGQEGHRLIIRLI